MGSRITSSPLYVPLRHTRFRRLFLGQVVSAVGDQIFPIAIVGLVIGRGGSAADLAVVLAGRALAAAALVIFGGLLADRFRRTSVMIGADAVRLVAVLGLAVSAGHVPVLGLAALTFLVGAGEAFFRPAYTAVMPTVLPADALRGGNALTALSQRVGIVVGPLLGGVIVATLGAGVAFGIDAATFGVSLVMLLRIAESKRPPATDTTGTNPVLAVLRESRAGLVAVRQRPWLSRILIVGGVQQVAGIGPLLILLPAVTTSAYGEQAFGLVLTCFGGGSILGAIVGGHMHPARPGFPATVGLCSAALPLLALAGPAPLWVICVAFFVAAVGMDVFGVLWETALQLDVPDDLLGRVSSLDWLTTFGLLPIGMAVGGAVATRFGITPVAIGCAAVILLTGPTILMVPGGTRMSSAAIPPRPELSEPVPTSEGAA